jgi:hypothetical protein
METIVRGSVFVLVTAVASLSAQGEVDARATVAKGATVWFVHETEQGVQFRLQGRDLASSQTSVRTLHIEVRDIDVNGNYVVATKLVRIHGKYQTTGQGEIEFDSAGEGGGNDLARMMTAGAGKTFVSRIDPRGQVLELGEGAEAIVKEMEMNGMQPLTTGVLKQLVRDAFGLMPPKRTAGGAQWKAERVEFQDWFPTRQALALTLTDVAPEAFVIEGTGTLDLARDVVPDEKDRTPRERSVQRQLENSKMEAGKVTIRQKTGRADGFVRESTSSVAFDLLMNDPDLGEIPMQVKVETKLRRTTADAALPKAEPTKEPPKEPAKEPGGK